MSLSLALFTRDSHSVLANARRIAKQHKQELVTPHHLLLGLLELVGCQGERVLGAAFPLKLANLKAQVLALVRVEAKQAPSSVEIGYKDWQNKLSAESAAILKEAILEAKEHDLAFVDTRVLLLGMLRHPDNGAGNLLRQYDVQPEVFREQARLKELPPVDLPRVKLPSRADLPPIEISPVFLGLVAWNVLFGYLTYAGIGNPSASGLFFLLGGTVLCVALHEFGHALVAYLGGDESVVHKGYLTLNPLKYAHPILSIAFPLIFLLMGGLPLPGGAVYINPLAIRGRHMRSLTSAAGPIATLLCAIVLAIPFVSGLYLHSIDTHFEFWAVLAALLLVQLGSLFLNLLPIPGIDGFGIIEPYLDRGLAEQLNLLSRFTFMFLFILFRHPTALRPLWMMVWGILELLGPGVDYLAWEGLVLCMPWTE